MHATTASRLPRPSCKAATPALSALRVHWTVDVELLEPASTHDLKASDRGARVQLEALPLQVPFAVVQQDSANVALVPKHVLDVACDIVEGGGGASGGGG